MVAATTEVSAEVLAQTSAVVAALASLLQSVSHAPLKFATTSAALDAAAWVLPTAQVAFAPSAVAAAIAVQVDSAAQVLPAVHRLRVAA